MSTVVDISPKLGEYMLKGWILTDDICQTCRKIPLMRSPAAHSPESYYCACCDSIRSRIQEATNSAHSASSSSVNSSMSSGTHISRPSTPPTEVSSVFSSPVFAPVDTEEVMRRRQQSDLASSEIGKRMLKGWAMLADECPNSECYGIPLIRPPKTGSERDPRKECVICHTVYVDQTDENGLVRLVSTEATSAPLAGPSSRPVPAPSDRPAQSSVSRGQDMETITSIGEIPDLQSSTVPPWRDSQSKIPSSSKSKLVSSSHNGSASSGTTLQPTSATLATLEGTARALESSLRVLTERINLLSQASVVNPTSIGQTADAIYKVSLALQQVKQLHWSEITAYVT
ncbi:unnamed protein product [Somion occarium]|uniref:Sjogrens syndrome scleroderma autoantigen 1 family protein n=1 Tax=Somion occarium TaxID=3059160 RepID=A0ABP1D5J2_9APHY